MGVSNQYQQAGGAGTLTSQRRSFVGSSDLRRSPPSDIAILGGGLTGLVTALHLSHLLPNARLTLYEASDRLGGWIHTTEAGQNYGKNIILEHGPRVVRVPAMADKTSDAIAFQATINALRPEKVPILAVPQMPRYVYYPDHLVEIPAEFSKLRNSVLFGPDPLLRGLWRHAVRLLSPVSADKLVSRGDDPYWDQSIGDAVDAIFGSDTPMSVLTSSMLAGIYGGDPYHLSARNATPTSKLFPQYLDMADKGALGYTLGKLRAKILANDSLTIPEKDFNLRQTHSSRNFWAGGGNYVFTRGASSFVGPMVSSIRKNHKMTIKTDTRVERLSYDKDNHSIVVSTAAGGRNTHQKVISTLFSRHLAELSRAPRRSNTPTLLPALAETEAATILAVSLWYPREGLVANHPGFGYLVSPTKVSLQKNPEMALGVMFDSYINPTQAESEGGTKLTVLIGGHHWVGVPLHKLPSSREDAEALARSVLSRQLGIPEGEPAVVAHKLCIECIPQHLVGHRERMARAHDELISAFHGRLSVAGPSYTRPGVLGSIRAGMEISHAIADPTDNAPNSYSSVGDTGLKDFVGHERMSSIKTADWKHTVQE